MTDELSYLQISQIPNYQKSENFGNLWIIFEIIDKFWKSPDNFLIIIDDLQNLSIISKFSTILHFRFSEFR